jgi:hypothetical protein
MATSLQDNVTPLEETSPPADSPQEPLRRHRARWLAILLIVWCASGFYEGTHLKRGWVPWDAGAYAQSAERVLAGQLPHRDFTEVYTGGLTYLNAAAMRAFGVNLAAERIMLFVFFLAWVPALYWIASRFCRDWIAGALTFLAVAWSVPNYSEAVPSWYNLFLATFGAAALLAYTKRPRWIWPFLAGVCGGFSFFAKSVGLCYVAGALLFFAFHEQTVSGRSAELESPEDTFASSPARGRLSAYSVFLFACVAVFLFVLIHVISQLDSSGDVILFIVPGASLCSVLVWNEVETPAGRASLRRFAELLRVALPFLAGAIVPFVIFLAPYARAHATGELLRDLFSQASSRIAMAHDLPDDTITIIPTIFLAALLALSARVWERIRWVFTACVAGLLASGMLYAVVDYHGYIGVWAAAYWIVPVVTVAGSYLLMHSERLRANPAARERIFLLLALAALCSLVEFPFSSPIYFCYVAPLAILALAAVLEPFPRVSRTILEVLFAGFLIFAVFEVTPGFIYDMGFRYAPDAQRFALDDPRAGGLRTDAQTASVYNELIPLVRAHAADGDIYAGPDSPEVYFLAGYPNLTPNIYDFLGDTEQQHERVRQMIRNLRVRVMVVNENPALSPTLDEDLREEIARAFPNGKMVGNFAVRWR